MRTSVFALLVLAAAAPASAAPPLELEARLVLPKIADDAGVLGERVLVGDPFHIEIDAAHAPGGIALLPTDIGLGGSIAERTSARTHQRLTRDGREVDRYRLEFIAFEAGTIGVPAIQLALGSTTAKTSAFEVYVESSLSAEEQMVASSTLAEAIAELENFAADDPEAANIFVDDYRIAWMLLALAVLGGVVYAAWRWSKHRPVAETVAPPPPPRRPAHEIAFERIAALENAGYLDRGEEKQFFVELSAIVREYLGNRFSFDSLELTVDELMDALRAKQLQKLDLPLAEALLRRADNVKFAKFIVLKEQGDASLLDARELVETTRVRQLEVQE